MTDDTDHPLDAELGGDNLVHLPAPATLRARGNGRRKSGGKAAKRKAATTRAVGAPTKYKPEFAEHAGLACERGATDRELADFFHVSNSTIHEWRVRYPEFASALRLGKEFADERVERSLYNRAVGYTFDAEKVFANGYRASVAEHLPPDVGAAHIWLKNRRPAQWRDVQKVDHTHQIKSSAEILEEIKRDVVDLGLLPDGSFGEPEAG